ncbi:InlB B-repeat-containing protein [Candidatus Saccharibacteria bacterium]|nr:InlB B-repeat-containing protein [Candidatus Saccharibacteria bacterium]
MLIHTKPKIKSNKTRKLVNFSAISYALITLLNPVIFVTTNYSSVFASSSDQQILNFSVVVSDAPFLQLSLSGTDNGSLALDLNPKATSGDFNTTDGDNTPFKALVTTTNDTGYELNMRAESSSLNNSNGYSISPVDVSYPGTGKVCTQETISSNTCTFNDNSWGYKLNAGTNGNTVNTSTGPDTGYFAMPTVTSRTVGKSSAPVDDAETSVTFAAKVDHTIPSGSYTTKIIFEATANVTYVCAAGSICYDDNGADSYITHGITMGVQSKDDSGDTINNTTVSNGHTVTLWASNFRRDGYGFLGWNTQKDGKGTMYGPNETLSNTEVNNLLSSGKQLYAIWLKASEQYTMQTFNDTVCKTTMTQVAMNNGVATYTDSAFIALEDTRDGNVYAVARLADGNCWMIENLRLGNYRVDGTTATNVLTVNNTNNPTLSSLSMSTTSWCTDTNSTNGPGCMNQSNLNTNNTVYTVQQMSGTNQNIYSYGNYYNWYSATAGNGTYSSSTINNDTDGDLCPSNWILPSGGSTARTNYASTNNFWALGTGIMKGTANETPNSANSGYSQWTSGTEAMKIFRIYPNNFIYSGSWYSESKYDTGSGGRWWSRTTTSNIYAFAMHINNNVNVYPGTNHDNYKTRGFTVRCLASN